MLVANLETGITCSRIAESEQIFPTEGLDGELKMPRGVGLLSLQRELAFFDGYDVAVFIVFSPSSPYAWRIRFADARKNSSVRRKSFQTGASANLDLNTNRPCHCSVDLALKLMSGKMLLPTMAGDRASKPDVD